MLIIFLKTGLIEVNLFSRRTFALEITENLCRVNDIFVLTERNSSHKIIFTNFDSHNDCKIYCYLCIKMLKYLKLALV